MAVIVALADRAQHAPPRKQKEPVEAQILWFTGVRYERITESPKRRSAPRASRVKNKESA